MGERERGWFVFSGVFLLVFLVWSKRKGKLGPDGWELVRDHSSLLSAT